MHNEVRQREARVREGERDHPRDAELQKQLPVQLRHLDRRSSRRTSTTPRTSSRGRSKEKLDIVFNMVRFTEPMLGNAELEQTCRSRSGADEERMRQFFLERVRMDPLLDGQNYIYMHYADMIANGYHRAGAVPVPDAGHHAEPGRRPVLLREQRRRRQRHSRRTRASSTSARPSQAHRDEIRDEKCPTCLSPCQMNVAAVKQVVPYVKFLVRATNEKRRGRQSDEPPGGRWPPGRRPGAD